MAQVDVPGYLNVLDWWDFEIGGTEAGNRNWRFGLRLSTNVEVTSANCIKYFAHGGGSGGAWIYTPTTATMTADADLLTHLSMVSPTGGLVGVRALTIKYRTDGVSSEIGTWEGFAEGDLSPAIDIPEAYTLKITSLVLTVKSGSIEA